ncbi:MAG: class I SAM-dependent methyltransferase [Saprospirales bacterium]|nr:class I SAM-dependent methyltransferase [Saprospirales bacterium]
MGLLFENDILTGFSGKKLVGTLQRLARQFVTPEQCYLEIGVFQYATVINQDYEDALENLKTHIGEKKVGLFFIDGPHDYRSQLMCLLLIQPFLPTYRTGSHFFS